MPILTTVGVFVGSLRKASFNRKIASPLMGLAPETLSFEIVEIGDLPIYNQDLDDEGAPPAAWQAFRAEVAPIDAVLCVTPKYNRSVPAVLKNALDAGSRPCWFAPVWTERLERQTRRRRHSLAGSIGRCWRQPSLRQSLVVLNVPTLQQPEAYLGGVTSILNEDGEIESAATRKFLSDFMEAFASWVATNNRRSSLAT
jgi:chromate reductase